MRDVVSGTLKLYVDGQLAGTQTACVGSDATGNTVIGRAKFGGNPVDFWRGAIDQVTCTTGPCPTPRSRPCTSPAGNRRSGPAVVRAAAGSTVVPVR